MVVPRKIQTIGGFLSLSTKQLWWLHLASLSLWISDKKSGRNTWGKAKILFFFYVPPPSPDPTHTFPWQIINQWVTFVGFFLRTINVILEGAWELMSNNAEICLQRKADNNRSDKVNHDNPFFSHTTLHQKNS